MFLLINLGKDKLMSDNLEGSTVKLNGGLLGKIMSSTVKLTNEAKIQGIIRQNEIDVTELVHFAGTAQGIPRYEERMYKLCVAKHGTGYLELLEKGYLKDTYFTNVDNKNYQSSFIKE
jgi:hypothetical protein